MWLLQYLTLWIPKWQLLSRLFSLVWPSSHFLHFSTHLLCLDWSFFFSQDRMSQPVSQLVTQLLFRGTGTKVLDFASSLYNFSNATFLVTHSVTLIGSIRVTQKHSCSFQFAPECSALSLWRWQRNESTTHIYWVCKQIETTGIIFSSQWKKLIQNWMCAWIFNFLTIM